MEYTLSLSSRRQTLWLLLLLNFIGLSLAAQVVEPADLRRDFLAPGITWLRVEQPIVTGELVYFNPSDPSPANISGKIAYSLVFGNIPSYIRNTQSLGAKAVVVFDLLGEYPTYDLVMSFDTENIDITVVQIGNIDTAWFNSMLVPTDDESSLKFNFSIIVTIGGAPEYNYWTEARTNNVWIFMSVLMGSFALINGAFAVAKLIAYLRHVGRAELSVPQICLTFEIIGNILRLIYWVMDPVFLIRGVFSYLASQLFTSITNPIMITSTVLVAIYWAELLEKSSVKVTTKLRKFTIPFIIICIVTFFIVFIVSGLQAYEYDPSILTTVNSCIQVAMAALSVFYFLIQGIRVLRMLRAANGIKAHNRREGRANDLSMRTARYVIASAVFQVLFIIVAAVAASPGFWSPPVFYTSLTLKDVALYCISFVQILVFKWPSSSGSLSSNSVPSVNSEKAATGAISAKKPHQTASGLV